MKFLLLPLIFLPFYICLGQVGREGFIVQAKASIPVSYDFSQHKPMASKWVHWWWPFKKYYTTKTGPQMRKNIRLRKRSKKHPFLHPIDHDCLTGISAITGYSKDSVIEIQPEKVISYTGPDAYAFYNNFISEMQKIGDSIVSHHLPYSDTIKQPLIVLPKVLYVLDGVLQRENPIGKITPEYIKSIKVLKSSEAVSRYGKRGEDGAIIITTMRKKVGL